MPALLTSTSMPPSSFAASATERMNAAAMCFPIPEAPAVTRTLRDMGDLQNSRAEPVDALTDAIHPDCAVGPTDADKGRIPVHSRATQHHAQRLDSLCRGAIFFGLQIVPNLRYRRCHQYGVAFCTCNLATTTLCVALKLNNFSGTKRLG